MTSRSRLLNPHPKQIEFFVKDTPLALFAGARGPYSGTVINWVSFDEVSNMNEKIKIALLEKQKAAIFTEANNRGQAIDREIEKLKNPVNKYPSLRAAFAFLDLGDYAPGYWKEANGSRNPIATLDTEHLRNILDYLDSARKLVNSKSITISDKKFEIENELKRRGDWEY